MRSELPFFVPIYEDELFYSILCRYHKRTGNTSALMTRRELFKEVPGSLSMGTFNASNLIFELSKRLPKDFLNVRDMILSHTFFPYSFRFYKREEKEEHLKLLIKGKESYVPGKGSDSIENKRLCYCPLCMKEDLLEHGETYWHRKHQIPHIKICTKHHTKLKVYNLTHKNERNNNFILPEDIMGKNIKKEIEREIKEVLNEPVTEDEAALADILESFMSLPYTVGITSGYNNLITGMINAGLGDIKKSGFSIRKEAVEEAVEKRFSKELITDFFGENGYQVSMTAQLRNFIIKTPERYAALLLLIGKDARFLFGKEVENEYIKTYFEMQKKLKTQGLSREKAAKEYSKRQQIDGRQLNSLCAYLNEKPFWREKIYGDTRKRGHIHLTFTEEQKNMIENYIKDNGYNGFNEFFLMCAFEHIKISHNRNI